VGPGPNDRGLSRRHIFSQIEASLKRLGTDYLDVYYAHHPDMNTPIDETMRAFDDLVRQGKVLYPALSTFPAALLVEALWRCDKGGFAPPVVNQLPYSLAMRSLERDLIPACQKHGVSLTAYSPLAGGLFAGPQVLEREFAGSKRWGGAGFSPDQLRLAAELQAVSEKSGIPSAVLALNWLIAQPNVASAIIGPETLEELEASASAVDETIPDAVLAEVDAIGKPLSTGRF
jgi:1-deoxyxylulose-5-phosphate synthase